MSGDIIAEQAQRIAELEAALAERTQELREASECDDPMGVILRLNAALAERTKERDAERAVRETAEREAHQHAEREAELYQERDALAAALEPFVRWANQLDSPPNWVPNGCPLVVSPADVSDFCVGYLRKARDASGDFLSTRLAAERKAGAIELLQTLAAKYNQVDSAFLEQTAKMIERGEVKA